MKIIVDKMPEHPIDCRYSEIREKDKKCWWVSCTKGRFVCEDTKKCKYFRSITDFNMDESGISLGEQHERNWLYTHQVQKE